MGSILTLGGVDGFFEQAVGSAIEAKRVEASNGVREYLVGLLVDFAKAGDKTHTLEKPVTLLFDEAIHAPEAERFGKLKDVGDGSLYVTGIFREHLERKGIDVGYVTTVGASAYGRAASLLGNGDGTGPNLFAELASKFARFVDVLGEVACAFMAGAVNDPAGLVKAYERWQKTGSTLLGRELASRGIVPMKPCGGVQ